MTTQLRRSEGVALLLLASAWGWNGGNFSQPSLALDTQIFITAAHYVPIALIVGLGGAVLVVPSPAWVRTAITVVVLLGMVALGVIVAIGISNPDPNSFGPHNFADYVPVCLLVIGAGTWFVSQARRRAEPNQSVGASEAIRESR